MRLFLIEDQCTELHAPPNALPETLPAQGFVWVSCARSEFEAHIAPLQAALLRWTQATLVDLHVSDLLNHQLPSHFDYTSWYDLLVFRRLAAAATAATASTVEAAASELLPNLGASIDTNPVGFVVFERVLLTVHPEDCQVRDFFASRLLAQIPTNGLHGPQPTRLPASPADLMLRICNHMVDGYLDLRRQLTRQFSQLQHTLLGPGSHHIDWQALLSARDTLHRLEDTCEDQRSAVQEWIDALEEWPVVEEPGLARERELLRLRSRDVLEHIERVLGHVRRLESSMESAVQMHYSAVGQRTNDIMRTLTVLTAIFLPLNLVTGIFGMNFDALPLIHTQTGFWIAATAMLALGGGLGVFFWRKRYLSSAPPPRP